MEEMRKGEYDRLTIIGLTSILQALYLAATWKTKRLGCSSILCGDCGEHEVRRPGALNNNNTIRVSEVGIPVIFLAPQEIMIYDQG